jgi:hypothetical protein
MDEFNRELRLLIGDLTVQNIMLRSQLGMAQAEVARLNAEVARAAERETKDQ